MELFFRDIGFLDAERAYGAVLRHLPWPVLRHLPWPVLRHLPWPVLRHLPWPVLRHLPWPVLRHLPWPVLRHLPWPVLRHLPWPVLRHAKRACCWWIPGALDCFKGAGEPHRTPALMAGFNGVPCASAARRPAGSLLAWNRFLVDIGFPDARSHGWIQCCSLRVSTPAGECRKPTLIGCLPGLDCARIEH